MPIIRSPNPKDKSTLKSDKVHPTRKFIKLGLFHPYPHFLSQIESLTGPHYFLLLNVPSPHHVDLISEEDGAVAPPFIVHAGHFCQHTPAQIHPQTSSRHLILASQQGSEKPPNHEYLIRAGLHNLRQRVAPLSHLFEISAAVPLTFALFSDDYVPPGIACGRCFEHSDARRVYL